MEGFKTTVDIFPSRRTNSGTYKKEKKDRHTHVPPIMGGGVPHSEWQRDTCYCISMGQYQGKPGVPLRIGSSGSRLLSATELHPLWQLSNFQEEDILLTTTSNNGGEV